MDFFQHHSFRPVAELSLYTDYLLWGENAYGYHLTNLIIHLLCSLFLYRFSHIFLKRYSHLPVYHIQTSSLIAAGAFLIYAFHSEAILWILGRAASLCTLFFLISITCWLKKEIHITYFLLSLLFFMAGLLTYEAIWIMPVLVSAIHLYERIKNKIEKKQTIFLACFIILFIVYLLIRYFILGEFVSSYELKGLQGNFLSNIFLNYNRLLARSFLPPMYSSLLFGACYALLIFFSVFLLIKKRKQNFLSQPFLLLLFMFLSSLIPFVFFGIDTHTTESERFLYLPSALLCIYIGSLFATGKLPKTVVYSILIFIFLYHSFFAFSNSRDHRIAGAIAKEVLQKIRPFMQEHKIIEIHHLPIQLNGAPIFRKGFQEAAAWLYQADTGRIIIHNTAPLTSGPGYFDDLFSPASHLSIHATQKENDTVIVDIIPDEKFFHYVK